MTEYSRYMQLYYEILLTLCNSDTEQTINTLSVSLGQPSATIRRILYDFFRGAEEIPDLSRFTPTVNRRKWQNFKESEKKEFMDGKYDDASLLAFPSGESIAVTLEEYEKMSRILFSEKPEAKEKLTEYLVVDGKYKKSRQLIHKTNNTSATFNPKESEMYEYCDENGNGFFVFGTYEGPEDGILYAISRPVENRDEIHFIPFENLKKQEHGKKEPIFHKYLDKAKTLRNLMWAPEEIPWDFEQITCRIKIHNSKKKIFHDLSRLSSCSILQEENDSAEAEFAVVITKGFLSWLIGFGSSITVLYPDSVRNYIIAEYSKILEKYPD